MSDRSVPITLDKEYELRFEPEDVEACESELMMGYPFFFKVENNLPIYLSLRLCKSLLHHGLRTKDSRGDLLYALPQNGEGARLAGSLIQTQMQAGTQLFEIWLKCREAFDIGWFAKPKEDSPVQESKEPVSKNQKPGTGSNRRDRTH